MEKFIMHTDPGHGWLEVPVRTANRLLLDVSDFSRYSFIRGETLFLEEDCAASLFIRCWEQAIGPIQIEERYSQYEHWIRALPRIEVEIYIDDEIIF